MNVGRLSMDNGKSNRHQPKTLRQRDHQVSLDERQQEEDISVPSPQQCTDHHPHQHSNLFHSQADIDRHTTTFSPIAKSSNNKSPLKARENVIINSCDSSSKLLLTSSEPVSVGDLSGLQESGGDLHWFTEDSFKGDSSATSATLDIPSQSTLSTNSFGYGAIARDRDANLAQIDMETFRTEDINNLYTLSSDHDQSRHLSFGHRSSECNGSIVDEMTSEDHYINLNSREMMTNDSDCSTLESSLDGTSNCFSHEPGNHSDHIGHNSQLERSTMSIEAKMDISGVSADSLDSSSAESTQQIVLRCREQDKTRYKIAFEESISSVKSDYLVTGKGNRNDPAHAVNHQQYSNYVNPGVFRPSEHRRKPHRESHNAMVRSEYTYAAGDHAARRVSKHRTQGNMLHHEKGSSRQIAKQSQSLPDIVHTDAGMFQHDPSFAPLGRYLPLYDIHNNTLTNTSSSNSETSPPRSLIRLFIQNRRSPSSCSPLSSCTSFDDNLNDSSDSNTYSAASTKAPKFFVNPSYFQRKARNNNHSLNNANSPRTTMNPKAQPSNIAEYFEDSLVVSDENASLLPRGYGDRKNQASPIREESELADPPSHCDERAFRREIGTGTEDGTPCWPERNIFPVGVATRNSGTDAFTPARRSVSVDRFVNPSFGSISHRRNTVVDVGSSNLNKLRFGREFGSLSSGYHSSRQCLNESHRNHTQENISRKYIHNIMVVKQKTASTQVPVTVQDKQVQASLSFIEGHKGFILRDHSSSFNNIPASHHNNAYTTTVNYANLPYNLDRRNSECNWNRFTEPDGASSTATTTPSQPKKPLYVCYPNYSLPDLNFLKNISTANTPGEDGATTIHLSPTKLDLPSQTTPSLLRRNNRKGIRPKSCTDYENMIANRNFNHIKDWDSLKVLLPNELRSLLARLGGENISKEKQSQTKNDNINIIDANKAAKIPVNRIVPDNVDRQIPSQQPGEEIFLRRGLRGIRRANSSENPASRRKVSCPCVRNKRLSLQEPLPENPTNGYHGNTCPDPSCVHFRSDYPTHGNCSMTRSATMPSCVCHAHQLCHQPTCCCDERKAHRTLTPCCQGKNALRDILSMDPSEDRLCNLLSRKISLGDFTSLINGGQPSYRASRLSSPSNPYAPIKEQAEESESYLQADAENSDNKRSSQDFYALKNHWEQASSPTPHKTPKQSHDDGRNSFSKVPEAPSSRTPVKASVKQPLSNLRSTSLPVPAKRPTSLGTNGNFRSMIPIAKGSKISPSGAKIISPAKSSSGPSPTFSKRP
ncbi:uncharacterized protein LOC141857829 [Brevipalpus obovatus]|uniref:uncharacterized protein LOC141857829 n=1 Tax=Brevipalpus obovatus TaxID=246614 RepID=UPI003D9E1204